MSIISRLFWKSIPKPERKLLLSLLDEPNRQVADKILNQKHSFPIGFDENECIFIHVPKVAGISIAQGLGFHSAHTWHLPLKYYEATEPDKYENYFNFGLVRNPWDRLFSAYQFLQKGGISEKDSSLTHLVQRYPNFDSFVSKWLSKEAARSVIHLTPMHHFFENQQGMIAADFIGRFENIEQDYNQIREKLGIGDPLPHLNPSSKTQYTHQYSTKMIDKVAKVYERDISEFNYDFD